MAPDAKVSHLHTMYSRHIKFLRENGTRAVADAGIIIIIIIIDRIKFCWWPDAGWVDDDDDDNDDDDDDEDNGDDGWS